MKVMKFEELRIAGRTILLSAFLISALSCSERQMDEVPGRVRFRFAPAADTRSGIAPDENSVENVNIAVYRFGVLHSAMFFDGEAVPEMTLGLCRRKHRGEDCFPELRDIHAQMALPHFLDIGTRGERYGIHCLGYLENR